ncbi:MAG: hypothetical protein LBF94_00140 [Puniceicoccales bacterium]|jgi:hypothetical protein|nr:hypothetical protein [Puniceicoccales bacterium]
MNMENIDAIMAGGGFFLDAPSGVVDSALVPQPGHFNGRHLAAGDSAEFRKTLKSACLTRSMSLRSLKTLNAINGYCDYFKQVASVLITRLKNVFNELKRRRAGKVILIPLKRIIQMIESGLQNLPPPDLLLKTQSMMGLLAGIKTGLDKVAHSLEGKFPDIRSNIQDLISEFCPIFECAVTLAMKEVINS